MIEKQMFFFFSISCDFEAIQKNEILKENKTKTINDIQLSTVDLLARVSMKNVAKCDK